MSDQHYVHKALGEVVRLADEKIAQAEDTINRKEDELRDTTRSCEETIGDLTHYFSLLTKQLERWKLTFTQEIHKNISDMQSEFRSIVNRIQDGLEKLRELRETSAQVLAMGQCNDSELVYQVHGCIFSINQEIDTLSEYVGRCIPLKFVGNLNFENMQKASIGTLEHLCDTSCAEILPSKLPKIKLGRLFYLEFRIAKKYCESARKFITFSVTKEEGHSQKVCAYLQDNKNGTYALSFPITVIVPHTVNVCYLGEHIRNSPYTIAFKVDPNQVAPGPPQQTSGLLYPGGPKEIAHDVPTSSTRVVGRAMGDDRDACKRNKWQNTVDNMQQNNNWKDLSLDQKDENKE